MRRTLAKSEVDIFIILRVCINVQERQLTDSDFGIGPM